RPPTVLPPFPYTTLFRSFVSESWKQATVRAAVRHAAGGTQAAVVSATVAAMAEGASRAMILHRLMKWAALLSLIGIAASGAGMRSEEHTSELQSRSDLVC